MTPAVSTTPENGHAQADISIPTGADEATSPVSNSSAASSPSPIRSIPRTFNQSSRVVGDDTLVLPMWSSDQAVDGRRRRRPPTRASARRSTRRPRTLYGHLQACFRCLCFPIVILVTLLIILFLVVFGAIPFVLFMLLLLLFYYGCSREPIPPMVLLRALLDWDDGSGMNNGPFTTAVPWKPVDIQRAILRRECWTVTEKLPSKDDSSDTANNDDIDCSKSIVESIDINHNVVVETTEEHSNDDDRSCSSTIAEDGKDQCLRETSVHNSNASSNTKTVKVDYKKYEYTNLLDDRKAPGPVYLEIGLEQGLTRYLLFGPLLKPDKVEKKSRKRDEPVNVIDANALIRASSRHRRSNRSSNAANNENEAEAEVVTTSPETREIPHYYQQYSSPFYDMLEETTEEGGGTLHDSFIWIREVTATSRLNEDEEYLQHVLEGNADDETDGDHSISSSSSSSTHSSHGSESNGYVPRVSLRANDGDRSVDSNGSGSSHSLIDSTHKLPLCFSDDMEANYDSHEDDPAVDGGDEKSQSDGIRNAPKGVVVSTSVDDDDNDAVKCSTNNDNNVESESPVSKMKMFPAPLKSSVYRRATTDETYKVSNKAEENDVLEKDISTAVDDVEMGATNAISTAPVGSCELAEKSDNSITLPNGIEADHSFGDDTSMRERTAMCDICLLHLAPGDVIAWSPNTKCGHTYHEDCISDWLLRKPTCPSCREVYITRKDCVECATDSEEG